ncbi:hypothetical protein BD414DRAFT_419062 [Trametes punicea]|nr:hypothetical protein BD414DRAFT_419062 [Trametes punicea]
MSEEISDGPPWYATDSDGGIVFEETPERLKSHPELQRRGIVLTDPLKIGFVYETYSLVRPRRVVKILNPRSEEGTIYEQLLRRGLSSPNHTVPCEITRIGHPLLIMPGLSVLPQLMPLYWSLYDVLSVMYQIVEGVEFLHSLRIAHMDLCRGNVLAASREDSQYDDRLVAGKIYIIDFDTSRRFKLGPGVQPAIHLPSAQIDPPKGLTMFDPYSWDVYCLGHVLSDVLNLKYSRKEPWLLRRYVQWLIGDERGCSGVCRCRPTARKARRVLSILRSVVYIAKLVSRVLGNA